MTAWRLFAGLLLCALQPSSAETVAVPDALQPWQAWVLHGEQTACPFSLQNFSARQCAWPGRLSVTVADGAVTFSQQWHLFAAGAVPLPGAEGYWPLEVQVDGAGAAVVEAAGRPQLNLPAGRHRVVGRIPFQTLPESLLIPAQTALVTLTQGGRVNTRNPLDEDGRLWLMGRQQPPATDASEAAADKLSVRLFRHLRDAMPFRMETLVELEVSGKPREMLLGRVLADGFVVESFDSPLPARIESDGRLRLQLRPGRWSIRLTAHRSDPVESLTAEPATDDAWPREEVWVFEAVPALRQVRVEGVQGIDPRQTALPAAWKVLPAYRLQRGQTMRLVELRRGDPLPAPNRLTLERTLWLDFDGAGMTVEDRLKGTLNRDWRLSAGSDLSLGSLHLDGQPQVITTLGESQGVEVRQGNLDAVALGRIAQTDSIHRRSLSSSGWQHDVDRLSARVQLPAGWRLLAVTGVDRATNTWAGSWSVWDVFIVLLAIVAVMRLRGGVAGAVCALALLLIYPEAPALLYLWLNVIVVMVAWSLLPAGRLRRVLSLYGGASVLALAAGLLGFLVTQARLGLYPQTLQASMPAGVESRYGVAPADEAVPAAAPEALAAGVRRKIERYESDGDSEGRAGSSSSIQQIDPSLAAQTGPGRPDWRWRETALYWSGPVTQAETFELVMLTPWENRLLAWLRVVLGVLMAVVIAGASRIDGRWRLTPWRGRSVPAAALALLVGIGGGALSPDAHADLPDAALLGELKQRLLQQRDCTPACLGIERLHIDAGGRRLSLRFTVHAREPVYWPLPDSQQQWRIDGATLDGEPHALRRAPQGGHLLQVAVPAGRHELQLSGAISGQAFQLTFPVMPHNVTLDAPAWEVRGIENGRLLSNGIYFEPRPTAGTVEDGQAPPEKLLPDPAPAFVAVRRLLRLGVDWQVQTEVRRVAPGQGGITLDIPLLPGESVTSQGLAVVDQRVRVDLKSGQNALRWHSVLDKTPQLHLQADSGGLWSEHWVLEASPLWHIESEGLAPVKETGVVGRWRPQWRPYPGERLTLSVSRPEAVAGVTTTIDRVEQTLRPGRRESQHRLRLHLISSKGSEQRIDLPAGSRISQVRVDDESRAVDEATARVVVAVNPGQHWVEVEWREAAPLSTRVTTPAVGLNAAYVNHSIQVRVPAGRWVLFAGGPRMGPAVLFWGVLVVVLILALGLGRLRQLPLRTRDWVVLALGLCAGWIQLMIPVVLWFVAMRGRGRLDPQRLTRTQFNLAQLALAALSLGTLAALLAAIPNGLLGTPDMGVVGNGSSQYQLNWFVDRGSDALSRAWFVSLPLWVYRALMLVWSLWLALSLLRWLKWGWAAFSHGGYWRGGDRVGPARAETPE